MGKDCVESIRLHAIEMNQGYHDFSIHYPDISHLIYHSRAIVLRTVKFGETSLIVDMYTEQKGHQTFIINSVRKAKAITPPAYLQLLTLVDIVAYHQDHKKINRVKEVRLNHTWQSIPFDMQKSAVITCLAEICSKCITTAEPHPELFWFLHQSLVGYDDPNHFDRDFLIRFLVSLSHFLGFGFDVPKKEVQGQYFDLQNGYMVQIRPAHNYLMPLSDIHSLKDIMVAGREVRAISSLEIRKRLVDQLVLYYQLHVDSLKEVHSLRILRELQ